MFPKTFFFLLAAVLVFSGCRSKEEWVEIFVKKGDQYLSEQKYEEAITEYGKAKRLGKTDGKVLLSMAEAYHALGNWGPVYECINTYLLTNSRIDARYYLMRGEAIFKATEILKDALDLGFNPAIAQEPSNGFYYYRRGLIYQQAGQSEPAAADFLKAEELGYRPNNS